MKLGNVVLLMGMVLLTGAVTNAQVSPAGGVLAVLPFNFLGVDRVSVLSAESLLRQELSKQGRFTLVAEDRTLDATGETVCNDPACAMEIGKKLGADLALMTSLNKLGAKVIIQYMLVDVATGDTKLLDNTTSTEVDDLDMVMKRIAMSVAALKPFANTAEVSVITQKETETPRRRSARRNAGLSFGYLFPENGYEGKDRIFAMDFRTNFEQQNFVIGSQLAIRQGFAFNLYGSYLFTRTDLCPYIGGGLGFHWVSGHERYRYDYDYEKSVDRDTDGFELIFHSGVRLFRTFNFLVLLNMDYTIVFNDYDDRAFVFTFGLLR